MQLQYSFASASIYRCVPSIAEHVATWLSHVVCARGILYNHHVNSERKEQIVQVPGRCLYSEDFMKRESFLLCEHIGNLFGYGFLFLRFTTTRSCC